MIKTLLGVFTDKDHVVSAINDLRDKGFDAKDVSIVMKNTQEAKDISNDTGADVAGGMASGAATGAILGGLAGLIAATVIPGLGAFFIGGPIATALGLTGAAASTVSGAATGAIAGGLLGALMGFGLSEDEARYYETRVNEGAILIAVPVTEADESTAISILKTYDASDIKVFTQTSETIHARSTTHQYADMSDVNEDTIAEPEEVALHHTTYAAGAKGGQTKTHTRETTKRKSE